MPPPPENHHDQTAMPRKVFISYSSRDRVEALALKQLVEDCGCTCWMDLFDIQPSGDLKHELEHNVDAVDVFCLLLSPAAAASAYVGTEIKRARAAQAQGLQLLPIILRTTAIPEALADLVGIDARTGIDDPAVAMRLRQFLAGGVPEGVLFDAINRAALADQESRIRAEAALGPLREALSSVWDTPLRELTLELDQDTWPAASGCVLELVMNLDIFLGSAHLLLAPYVEGATWRQDAGFEERAPEDVGASRVDARFCWAGRTLVLNAQTDGTDLGEQPLAFSLVLDGSEISGTERAGSMQLVRTFELPSLRQLVDKHSRISLWLHPPEGPSVEIAPTSTDLDVRLMARVPHDAIGRVCLWRSRHERAESVVLEAPSLKACASTLEREVLLSCYLPRPLRQAQNAPERRARITQQLDSGAPVAEEDRWAAAHLLCTRADLDAFKGRIAPAAEQYRASLNLMLEGFDPPTSSFAHSEALRSALHKLTQLLVAHGGEPSMLQQLREMGVTIAHGLHEAHPQDPHCQRTLADALMRSAELTQPRPGEPTHEQIAQATTLMDELAHRAPTLLWRITQAQAMRARADALQASQPVSSPPPVYARWLDPAAASHEVPTLCISALPRFSVRLGARTSGGARRLQLVDDELIALYGGLSQAGFFSVGCREQDGSAAPPFGCDAMLAGAPFSQLGLAGWAPLAWDEAATGDLAQRWQVDEVHAARVLLRSPDQAHTWRAYVVRASHKPLRWTVLLGFSVNDLGAEALALDDAEAALAWRSLQLS
jgi:hypothetical protein